MSTGNRKREFYYCLYLLKNKHLIEQVVGIKLNEDDILLDKIVGNRKVDIYAVSEDNQEVFVEVQLGESDQTHLEEILKIIDNKGLDNFENEKLDNFILIWIALDFKEDMLNYVENMIRKTFKNITFYAIELNKDVIYYLEVLNNIFINQVFQNLKIINEVKKQLRVVNMYYRLHNKEKVPAPKKQQNNLDLNKKQDTMEYIYKELRRQISYFPSVYRYKKTDNHVIVLGGGKSGIIYHIGINRKNYLYVTMRFTENARLLFDCILEKEDEAHDKLDFLPQFNAEEGTISTLIYYSKGREEMLVKQIVRILDKYIRYFSQYTFPHRKT